MSIYAVNGKEPIAAWIESLDPESVTSSKATDLIGTNHGTLTNMDLTADPDTARRADTDSGGVRALLLDGSDDEVIVGDAALFDLGTSSFSVSAWIKTSSSKTVQAIFAKQDSSNFTGYFFGLVNGQLRLVNNWGTSLGNVGTITSTGTVNNGAWRHVLGVMTGADRTNWRLYVDGSSVAFTEADSDLTGSGVNNAASLRIGSRDYPDSTFSGRMDDVRFWLEALTVTDAGYLWSSGNGRGIVASTGKKRPRINGSLINSGLCRSSI